MQKLWLWYKKHTHLLQILCALLKLCIGIYLKSIWFFILASYSIVLNSMRLHMQQAKKEELNPKYGIWIFIQGIVYLILCIWLFFHEEKIVYPNSILYGVVAFAFYKISKASYELFKERKAGNECESVLRIISFLDGCVSIVFIQYILLLFKGSSSAFQSSAMLGIVVSIFFMLLGIKVALTKKLKGIKRESGRKIFRN